MSVFCYGFVCRTPWTSPLAPDQKHLIYSLKSTLCLKKILFNTLAGPCSIWAAVNYRFIVCLFKPSESRRICSTGGSGRTSARRKAPRAGYLVSLVPLIPRFEDQLSVSVPALVQTLQLLQVDATVQSELQAPFRGFVLPLGPAAVPVAVSGHRGFKPRAKTINMPEKRYFYALRRDQQVLLCSVN